MSGMRIGGLASGMDIDGIVEKLMQAEKAPLNKLEQNKQTYEWQRDAYRDVNKELKAFDTFLFDEMTMQSNLLKKNVSSDNSAVTATNVSAKDGATVSIDSIESLATATRRMGGITAGTAKTKTMSELGLTANSEIKMSVMQKDGTFKDISIKVEGKDTLNDVMSKLSDRTGMSAFYDEGTGKISLTANATGEGKIVGPPIYNQAGEVINDMHSSIFVTEDSNNVLSGILGFGDNEDLTHSNGDNTGNIDGSNAVLTVNGIKIERQSNTFEVNGMSLTLNSTYNETNNPTAKPISLNASTDVDNMVDKIKKFVETYNGLVDSLNGKVKETKYRDYQPLTAEQKADMEKDDIEKWEEKSKSGLLRNDSIIRSGLSDLRNKMYEKGGSDNSLMDTLHELGITTTKSYLDGGKLEIDEDKLRAAISSDPEAVASTFSRTLKTGETGEEGIVQKLRSSLSNTMLNIEKKAGKATSTEHNYSIGKNLLSVDDRIDAWKSKLERIEERYWKQFTAMETAINKANQQSSIFMSGQAV